MQARELTRISERFSFVYVERATVHREGNAVTVTDQDGVLHVPSASLGCLLLGPGTRITHAAMSLLGESGASVVWAGENGVRFYAGGRSLARSTRLLVQQSRLVSSTRSRLAVARRMYAMRFPGEDVSALTMQQLRGREGARVRGLYRAHAQRTGVDWGRRDYDPQAFEDGDAVNRALTVANTCLYGIVHAVVAALGCSAGLGFVHTGNDRSFVYDIADLYKAEISIPVAFDVGSIDDADVEPETRRRVRDAVVQNRLLERCAKDISTLLLGESPETPEEWVQDDALSLWSGRAGGVVAGGVSYGAET
ncbi:type I-E CRISPR-associated endonuclease Cas1e [Micrococcus sp. EYE_162]|nr:MULTISPECIES: type I-E CRISPR-associated endonuclease Cas1e [unclassified Micrococcus]MCK6095594.1 type I-E CRISPR-associated endonuclease Cas1e [Micrococcus sp. EYE_212]MCK6171669.1 type I-E CRISPR-associated endonuclease Cas1e [Micrococcus sp. EYE_162]